MGNRACLVAGILFLACLPAGGAAQSVTTVPLAEGLDSPLAVVNAGDSTWPTWTAVCTNWWRR